jgi:hypothetical protein
MSENGRMLKVGSVGATPIFVDPTSVAHHELKITIGAIDFVATRPPGWPARPANVGAAIAEGGETIFAAGSTCLLHACEARALVAGGFARWAP